MRIVNFSHMHTKSKISIRIAPMGHHRQVHDKRKASVGMYSGCDYPYKSCLCTFDPAIPTSSFNYIVFYACYNNIMTLYILLYYSYLIGQIRFHRG